MRSPSRIEISCVAARSRLLAIQIYERLWQPQDAGRAIFFAPLCKSVGKGSALTNLKSAGWESTDPLVFPAHCGGPSEKRIRKTGVRSVCQTEVRLKRLAGASRKAAIGTN